MDYIFIQQVPDGFTLGRVHATGNRSYFPDAFEAQVLSILHQAQNVPELQVVNVLLGLERIPLEEADDALKVLNFPNPQFPAVFMVLADFAATEKTPECVQHRQVSPVLDYAEFRNNLITGGGAGMALDAYEEAAFTIDKTDHPFRG